MKIKNFVAIARPSSTEIGVSDYIKAKNMTKKWNLQLNLTIVDSPAWRQDQSQCSKNGGEKICEVVNEGSYRHAEERGHCPLTFKKACNRDGGVFS